MVSLLFLAMRLREDLHVESVVSPHLMRGLVEYQRLFASWFDDFAPVSITHAGFEESSTHVDRPGTGVLFSGGVDSFFSLQSHLPGHESIPGQRISHGLFIEGFDTRSPENVRASRRAFQQLFQRLGMTLVPVRTNLKDFLNGTTTHWRTVHGAFIISVPLLLQGLLRQCFVPSTLTYRALHDCIFGTNPLTDHLLSTESLTIVHDGAWASRAEKTARLADWTATHDLLYVCAFGAEAPFVNCCRCEKCIRTMIALEIAGALDRYTTFPKPLRRRDIRTWRMSDYEASKPFVADLVDYAQSEGRHDFATALRYVMLKHEIRNGRLGRFTRKLVVEPAKRSAFVRRLYHRYVHRPA